MGSSIILLGLNQLCLSCWLIGKTGLGYKRISIISILCTWGHGVLEPPRRTTDLDNNDPESRWRTVYRRTLTRRASLLCTAEESWRRYPDREATEAHTDKTPHSKAPHLGMQAGVGERAQPPQQHVAPALFPILRRQTEQTKCFIRASAQNAASRYLRRTVFLLCDASEETLLLCSHMME